MEKELKCRKPEEHRYHLCVLKNKVNKAELVSYVKNPQYVCEICKGKTNRGQNLCAPKKIPH